MTIQFTCPDCGQGYEVDDALAGRKARCKGCGIVVLVPARSVVATDQDHENYELEERLAVGESGGPSIYFRGPADPGVVASRQRAEDRAERIGQATRQATDFAVRAARLWPWLLGVPAGLAAVLGLIAAIVPGGTMIAGGILALVGIILLLGGHALGAYVAYTEDPMHGWFYLAFPLYTSYYIVANWGDMWRWVALTVAGAAILGVAGGIMGAGLERAAPEPDQPPADAWLDRPAGSIRLAVMFPFPTIAGA